MPRAMTVLLYHSIGFIISILPPLELGLAAVLVHTHPSRTGLRGPVLLSGVETPGPGARFLLVLLESSFYGVQLHSARSPAAKPSSSFPARRAGPRLWSRILSSSLCARFAFFLAWPVPSFVRPRQFRLPARVPHTLVACLDFSAGPVRAGQVGGLPPTCFLFPALDSARVKIPVSILSLRACASGQVYIFWFRWFRLLLCAFCFPCLTS
jgi:hypothetical protein